MQFWVAFDVVLFCGLIFHHLFATLFSMNLASMIPCFIRSLFQKHLARTLGLEALLVLQVLLRFGIPGTEVWLCRYL